MRHAVNVNRAQIGLVNEGRGLERLPRLFLGEALRRQLTQLVIDQRQELVGCAEAVVARSPDRATAADRRSPKKRRGLHPSRETCGQATWPGRATVPQRGMQSASWMVLRRWAITSDVRLSRS
jgi:hypothetical protein